MLNKSNIETIINKPNNNTNDKNAILPRKRTETTRKYKLNSILNRTLSDSVLNKKSSYNSYYSFHHNYHYKVKN